MLYDLHPKTIDGIEDVIVALMVTLGGNKLYEIMVKKEPLSIVNILFVIVSFVPLYDIFIRRDHRYKLQTAINSF